MHKIVCEKGKFLIATVVEDIADPEADTELEETT